MVRTAFDVLPSPARVRPATRPLLRVGLVQLAWSPDPDAHDAEIAEGVRAAADEGARLVRTEGPPLERTVLVRGHGRLSCALARPERRTSIHPHTVGQEPLGVILIERQIG